MRRGLAGLGVLSILGCGGWRDAFTSNVDVVAKAGDRELGVAALSEVIATGKTLPIRRDIVERLAVLWVEYALFADRWVQGDSLLDSARVVQAMWPDVQQRLADHYHENLASVRASLDSAEVDSAYQTGEQRLVDHILIQTNDEMSPDAKAEKRRQAERVRDRLARGASWREMNRLNNEDQATKELGGRLGVFARGEMIAAYENVAFALQPGELSGVTETTNGFYVLRRPPLSEVRKEYYDGVADRIVAQLDSVYLKGLSERWRIVVNPGVAPAVREAALDPVRGENSRKVIGTYNGGTFTIADFVRWLRAMPAEMQNQVGTSKEDDRVADFVVSLVKNQVLIHEADSAGVTITPADLAEFTDGLRRQLALLAALIGVDEASVKDSAGTPEQRRQLAALRVAAYLTALGRNEKRFMVVPPFLAKSLRDEATWDVVPAGIERALDRTRTLRASLDSSAAAAARARPAPTFNRPSDSTRAAGDTTGRPRGR